MSTTAVGKLLAKMKSGAELQMSDFMKLTIRTTADERAELTSLIADVAEGRFTKEHINTFATKYPILGADDVIIDHLGDVIDQIVGGSYSELISSHILGQ